MLTELNRITLLAITFGFISGLFQSILQHYLSIQFDEVSFNGKGFISKSFYLACSYGIIMGAVSFCYAAWQPIIPESEINRSSLILAVLLGFSPIFERLLAWFLSWSKKFRA